MPVLAQNFFAHIDTFTDYRKTIYEASPQTIKSNQCDLRLFERFIQEKNYETISGPVVIDFQYYLKQKRDNCGSSINRKLFTLRAYSNFLRLKDAALTPLPFYDVLKSRQGYRNRPNALSRKQVKYLLNGINRSTFLGIRDYTVYALMYQNGLRVGEVFNLNLDSIDFDQKIITVIGKGKKRRPLPLTGQMAQVLSEWIAARPHFCNSNKIQALFISKKGNRLAIRTMEDNFKKLVAQADLKTHFNITCHTLRHYGKCLFMGSVLPKMPISQNFCKNTSHNMFCYLHRFCNQFIKSPSFSHDGISPVSNSRYTFSKAFRFISLSARA